MPDLRSVILDKCNLQVKVLKKEMSAAGENSNLKEISLKGNLNS